MAVDPIARGMAASRVKTTSYVTDGIVRKIARLAAAARVSNPVDGAAISTPPTITLLTSDPGTFPNTYYLGAGTGLNQTTAGTPFNCYGGQPYSSGSHTQVFFYATTTATGSGYASSNINVTAAGGTRQAQATSHSCEFVTDSPKFIILMNGGSQRPFRLLRDGQYVQSPIVAGVQYATLAGTLTGYTSGATVTFSAPPAGGTTATGTVVDNGSGTLLRIAITSAGSGYLVPPTATIAAVGVGSGATGTAFLGARSSLVGKSNTWLQVDATQGGTIAYAQARGFHTWRIEMEQDATLFGVFVLNTETVMRPSTDDVLHVAVVGNSMDRGFGTGNKHDAWSQLLGGLMGWRDVWPLAIENTGVSNGGQGVANAANTYILRATDLDARSFDVVIVHNSLNDTSSTYAPTYQAGLLTLLQTIRQKQPTALIIVTGVYPGNTGPSVVTNGVTDVENMASAAVTAFADPATVFVPLSTATPQAVLTGTGYVNSPTTTGNTSTYIGGTDGADITHTNFKGHDFLARYYRDAILKALTSLGSTS